MQHVFSIKLTADFSSLFTHSLSLTLSYSLHFPIAICCCYFFFYAVHIFIIICTFIHSCWVFTKQGYKVFFVVVVDVVFWFLPFMLIKQNHIVIVRGATKNRKRIVCVCAKIMQVANIKQKAFDIFVSFRIYALCAFSVIYLYFHSFFFHFLLFFFFGLLMKRANFFRKHIVYYFLALFLVEIMEIAL